MQKNLPSYAPDWVGTATVVVARLEARGALPAVRRPPHAGVAGQPAGGRVPPGDGPRGLDHASHLVIDLDPPADLDAPAVASPRDRAARARGARRAGLGGGGEDQRRQGRARVRAARRVAGVRGRRRRHPGAGRAHRAARPRPRDHRVHQGRPRRRVFVDSTRAGGATVVAAYSPRVRPGLPVSFPVGWDDLHDAMPADLTVLTALERLGDARPVGGEHACAATAPGRPGGRGPRDPGRPRRARCTRASGASGRPRAPPPVTRGDAPRPTRPAPPPARWRRWRRSRTARASPPSGSAAGSGSPSGRCAGTCGCCATPGSRSSRPTGPLRRVPARARHAAAAADASAAPRRSGW